MRTVLVCVRTPLAAQTVASTAARLGMTGVVRTAVSETEAMIRLAERPAEVVLADTAVTRPDSVGFTRRHQVQVHCALAALEWNRPEKRRVDRREQSGVHPDDERQRHDGAAGVGRPVDQSPACMA